MTWQERPSSLRKSKMSSFDPPTLAAVAGTKEMLAPHRDGVPSPSVHRIDQAKSSAASTTDEAIMISNYPKVCPRCRLEFSSGNKIFAHYRDPSTECFNASLAPARNKRRGGAKRTRGNGGWTAAVAKQALRTVEATYDAIDAVKLVAYKNYSDDDIEREIARSIIEYRHESRRADEAQTSQPPPPPRHPNSYHRTWDKPPPQPIRPPTPPLPRRQ